MRWSWIVYPTDGDERDYFGEVEAPERASAWEAALEQLIAQLGGDVERAMMLIQEATMGSDEEA
jgi:hypothetical protein